jgi:predicted DCC family thiol-disulfide oxidoreductase YuxK
MKATPDPTPSAPPEPARVVVRFDGACLLCSRGIRFIAERDRADRIRFKALEGGGEPDSMQVETGGRVLDRSDAVIAILDALGGPWRALALLGRGVPRPWRDGLYRFVAARRYRWFGKGNACALPGEALRKRLLP